MMWVVLFPCCFQSLDMTVYVIFVIFVILCDSV
jgi:hypothetical protein